MIDTMAISSGSVDVHDIQVFFYRSTLHPSAGCSGRQLVRHVWQFNQQLSKLMLIGKFELGHMTAFQPKAFSNIHFSISQKRERRGHNEFEVFLPI